MFSSLLWSLPPFQESLSFKNLQYLTTLGAVAFLLFDTARGPRELCIQEAQNGGLQWEFSFGLELKTATLKINPEELLQWAGVVALGLASLPGQIVDVFEADAEGGGGRKERRSLGDSLSFLPVGDFSFFFHASFF